MIVAALLGTSLAADAFVIATRIPNLLRRLAGEGAMASSFVPVFSEWRARRGEGEAWDFARRFFWTLAVLMSLVVVAGVVGAPWIVRLLTLWSENPQEWSIAVVLTRITMPYALLISLAALVGACLNSVRKFGLPAATSIFLNLAIITAGLAALWKGAAAPVFFLAVGYLVGGALQLLMQMPSVWRAGLPAGLRLGFGHSGVKKVGILLLPAMAGVGVNQVNVVVSTAFASSQQGWNSALYFADRVMELVLGVYAVSIATVVLPVMADQAVAEEIDAMRGTLGFALRNAAFIVVPAMTGLILLREPITRVLFEHGVFGNASTELTAWALLFYAVGLPAFAAARIVVQGFYALQDTATPAWVAAGAVVVNVVLCFALIGPLRQGGLALAGSLAAYANVTVLYGIFRRRVGRVDEKRMAVSLLRTAGATAVMGAVCWWAANSTSWLGPGSLPVEIAALGGVMVGAVAVYFVAAWLLGAEEVHEFFLLLTGRRMPRAQA